MAGATLDHGLEVLLPDFQAYYATTTLIPVGGYKFRHFRFRSLDGTWIGVRRDISNARTLQKMFIRWNEAPRDLYHTVLRFLFPKELRHLSDGVPCLGGPIVFDLDATSKYILPSQAELERIKREILLLKDWLQMVYGFQNFSFVFSGHRGFHLYVNDFDLVQHVEDIDHRHREKQENRVRTRIAQGILQSGFPIDALITFDTRRIIRIPNSLHGRTGLKALLLSTERALWNFHLNNAIQFSDEPISLRITRPVPIFRFEDQIYGTFRPGQQLSLPKDVAYLLILSDHALANALTFEIEAFEADEDFLQPPVERAGERAMISTDDFLKTPEGALDDET